MPNLGTSPQSLRADSSRVLHSSLYSGLILISSQWYFHTQLFQAPFHWEVSCSWLERYTPPHLGTWHCFVQCRLAHNGSVPPWNGQAWVSLQRPVKSRVTDLLLFHHFSGAEVLGLRVLDMPCWACPQEVHTEALSSYRLVANRRWPSKSHLLWTI